ncbi:hypothetical protein [Stutzerimonas stutzeri]|uniref:hypothetical protein n=1 Tax=Stutzerimonas stutzeri TaxID=316 RepID=UPI003C6FA95F
MSAHSGLEDVTGNLAANGAWPYPPPVIGREASSLRESGAVALLGCPDRRQYVQQAVVPTAPQPGDAAPTLLLGRDHGEALAVAISDQAARGGVRSVPPHERRGC